MSRPLLLDLYCCAGGAAMGYHRAGFDVIGVDIVDRPNYPFTFVKADAVDVLRSMVGHRGCCGELGHSLLHALATRVVAVHTSPPCQEDNTLTKGTNRANGWGREHRQWVPDTRVLLDAIGLPYVIEQPSGGSVIRPDLRLCMDMFPIDPPRVFRHRDFEISGFAVMQPPHMKHVGKVRAWRGKNQGGSGREAFFQPGVGGYVAAYGDGGDKATVPEMQHALGIDWTDVREELTEAIPPAYTEFIGEQLLAHLQAEVAA